MRRALLLSVLALFAVACTARPNGPTGWNIYGPPGPAGVAGPVGPVGPQGPTGPGGSAGMQGQAGSMGVQGAQGTQGTQGQAGAVGDAMRWTKFKDILFDFDKSDLRSNETSKVSEIAAYLQYNPSAVIGIDGYADPRGTDRYNQALSERRVNAIRDALLGVGVPADKITTGAFGEMRLKCNVPTQECWQSDRRVEVLINAR